MRVALLVCDIIGFVLSIPAAFCGYMCAATGVGIANAFSSTEETDSIISTMAGMLWLFWLVSLVAFIFGIVAYAKPKSVVAIIGGILLILAGVILTALVVTGNVVSILAGALFVIAGVFALVAKPKPSAVPTSTPSPAA